MLDKVTSTVMSKDPAAVDNALSRDAISEDGSVAIGEVLSLENVDPVLKAKMHLLNNAIDQIGWTPYHWKLFFLAGFGYAVDSMLILIKSVTLTAVTYEFKPSYPKGVLIANNVGLLAGAFFWGLSADIIGRKWAFNISLFICSIFGLAAGASPNWISLTIFVALLAFGGGGNLVLDTTVFLEYLPSNKQYVLTLLAAWWGVGQTFTGFMAWAFLPYSSCAKEEGCVRADNMGWRYVFWTCCAVVFVMSVLRVTVLRLQETPKFKLALGEDEAAVTNLQGIAYKYNRPCDLTLAHLEACGTTARPESHAKHLLSPAEVIVHFRGLFRTKRMALSTALVWFSWTLIGLAYPLYQVFLPTYLESRGARFGVTSANVTWRNYTIANICSIFGPVAGGLLAHTRLGRRYTMVVGALATMAFFFAYTQVRNYAQNVAFTCVVNFTLNIYYGTLYAYTPEVLPSAHRSTGNGVAVGCNRLMGLVSTIVASFVDLDTAVPIFICAALYVIMAFVAAMFPFEPRGSRSS